MTNEISRISYSCSKYFNVQPSVIAKQDNNEVMLFGNDASKNINHSDYTPVNQPQRTFWERLKGVFFGDKKERVDKSNSVFLQNQAPITKETVAKVVNQAKDVLSEEDVKKILMDLNTIDNMAQIPD